MPKPAGRFRKFIAELKRRRVFRVATIYLVAAWAAVQVVTTVAPIIDGLPYWLPKAVLLGVLLGFPAALILAWAFDVTPEGVERTDDVKTTVDGETVHPEAVHVPWMRPSMGLLAVLLIFGGAYTIYLRMTRTTVDKGTAIAVFPFTVHGGPELAYLHEGMVNLLGTKLNGAGSLRSVDPNVLLKAVAAQPEKELREATARKLAQQFGAKAFILGDVSGSDGNLTLSASLYSVDNTNPPPAISVSGTEEKLFSLIDDLAQSLITSQFNLPVTRMARTAGLTTQSLPALKDYLNGEAEYRGARWRNAIDWFQQALKEDSTFALASYRLGDAAEWAADFTIVGPAAAQAYLNRKRLSDHDTDLVVAFHDWVNGHIATAETEYKAITAAYPEDAEGWYRLGEIQYHYNPFRGRNAIEARVPFERALQLDPTQEPIALHLMEIALYQQDYMAFDSLITHVKLEGGAALRRTAIRTFSAGNRHDIDSVLLALKAASDGTVNIAAHGLAQYLHNVDEAERVATIMTDPARPAPVRGAGLVLLAQLDVARGRWHSATKRFAQLDSISHGAALEYRALYASLPIMQVSPVELRTLRDNIERWNAAAEPNIDSYSAFLAIHNGVHPIIRSYVIGLLSARLKENDAAASSAQMLKQLPDTGAANRMGHRMAAGVTAESHWTAGDPAAALKDLDAFEIDAPLDPITNSPFFSHVNERFLMAELRYQKAMFKEALPWFQSMVQGHNELYLLGVSYLRRAQIYEKIGNAKLSQQYYHAFVDLWAQCDPELQPVLNEARSKLTKVAAVHR